MNEQTLMDEIKILKEKLKEKEVMLAQVRKQSQVLQEYGLNNEEITRYSRQILLSEISVKGQVKLKNSSVLIVGAGGLGCPAALYLTAAGVGHIGIVDYDDIELTNLHRQILFSTTDINRAKVIAAENSLTRLNENVIVTPYKIQLSSANAMEIVKKYDIVIDASDNVATRYLLNDACVISGKPLISGSALKFEGQLTVYSSTGPCYRCIFPTPPPPETVNNCGDSGVLGSVVGVIGVLQALQAVKIILDLPGVLIGRLLLFDGLDMSFRNILLRSKIPNCSVCGVAPTIRSLIDYEEFCGAKANDKEPNLQILKKDERISVQEYQDLTKVIKKDHVLVDVRSPEEFEICHLKDAVNIPMNDIEKVDCLDALKNEINKVESDLPSVFVTCRRGNDSQKAVKLLQKSLVNLPVKIKDIIGGIHAWTESIDPNFPKY